MGKPVLARRCACLRRSGFAQAGVKARLRAEQVLCQAGASAGYPPAV